MRTTLQVEDDVLQAARELAASENRTIGEIVSALMRKALQPERPVRARNGVPVLPHRSAGSPRPTMKLVNALRDES
jgi:hypothetical protein